MIDEQALEQQTGWGRFAGFFRKRITEEEQETAARLDRPDELSQPYPDDADEIIEFLVCALRRRQAIVEKLSKYPELNDHGFFMVICKLYRDTYHGIGLTNNRITALIEAFSTARITRATAARKLQKANEVGLFVSRRDGKFTRYFLHPEMIKICTEAFGGMMKDVEAIRAGEHPSDRPDNSAHAA